MTRRRHHRSHHPKWPDSLARVLAQVATEWGACCRVATLAVAVILAAGLACRLDGQIIARVVAALLAAQR